MLFILFLVLDIIFFVFALVFGLLRFVFRLFRFTSLCVGNIVLFALVTALIILI